MAPLDHRVVLEFWDDCAVAQWPVRAAQSGLGHPYDTAEGDLDDRSNDHDAKHHDQESIVRRSTNCVGTPA